MPEPRLDQQLRFILEIDKLKSVLRRSELIEAERFENSAEHSWHVALLAVVLAEYANEPIDLLRVVKMMLVHDIVEIDAGDTYAYDVEGKLDQHEREAVAAARLFGLLPDDQRGEFIALWEEFEERDTPESRFANAIDRLMPMFHNYHTEGRAWLAHGVTRAQVMERQRPIGDGADDLWKLAQSVIDDAVAKGYLQA